MIFLVDLKKKHWHTPVNDLVGDDDEFGDGCILLLLEFNDGYNELADELLRIAGGRLLQLLLFVFVSVDVEKFR